MKKTVLFLTSVIFLTLAGCASHPLVTSEPVFNPVTGQTNQVFVPGEDYTNAINKISGVVGAVPDTGFLPIDTAKDAALGILGLASAALGLFARVKTKLASNNAQAADLMAAHIVKSNTQGAMLNTASNSPVFSTIANHINNNTL